jgi:hypothetical protein
MASRSKTVLRSRYSKHVAKLSLLILGIVLIAASAYLQSISTTRLQNDQRALTLIMKRLRVGGGPGWDASGAAHVHSDLESRFPEFAYVWFMTTQWNPKTREFAADGLAHIRARQGLWSEFGKLNLVQAAEPGELLVSTGSSLTSDGSRGADELLDSNRGLTDWLSFQLLLIQDHEGFDGGKGFMRAEGDYGLIGYEKTFETSPLTSTVSDYIQLFEEMERPRRYSIVIAFREEAFDKLREDVKGWRDRPLKGHPRFDVGLNRAASSVLVSDQGYQSRGQSLPESAEISADIRHVEGPSLAALIYGPVDEARLLASDRPQLGRLSRLYGTLGITDAHRITGENIAAAYAAVTLLGMTFPAEYVAFGVGVAILLIITGLLVITSWAKLGFVPFRASDELISIALARSMGRALLWLILPGMAFFMAYPAWGLQGLTFAIYLSMAILTMSLGAATLWIIERQRARVAGGRRRRIASKQERP